MTKRTSLLAPSLLPLLSGLSLVACTGSEDTDGTTGLAATTGTGSMTVGTPTDSASSSGVATGSTPDQSMGPPGVGTGSSSSTTPSGSVTTGDTASTGTASPTGTMSTATGTMGTSTGTMGTSTGTMGTSTGTMGTSSGNTSGSGGMPDNTGGMSGDTGGMSGDTGGMSGDTGGMSGNTGGMSGNTGGGDHDGPDCVLPELPEGPDLTYMNQKLPDPFTFYDGTKVTTKSQWECRRKEILAMAAKYIYGPNPAKPDEVTGTVSGGTVSISAKVGDKTESFSASISGSGDVIALNLSSNGIVPSGSKSLSFGSGFQDKIKSLYGFSELNPNVANGWMLDRVMDVLELNPDSGHDPTKMMVSGCSGCGKGAFLAGIFSRVPLTVIVESGGGGAANLRQAEWFRHGDGQDIYQCSNTPPQSIDNLEPDGICGPWVTGASSWLSEQPSLVYTLPFDQHLLLATIAPRYLLHFTNNHGVNIWCHLGGTCEALSSWAAEPVWNALGVPERMGFMQYDAGHCGKPAVATNLANEFFKRAFQGDTSANTDVMEIMKENGLQQPFDDWKDMWIDWDMETVLQ